MPLAHAVNPNPTPSADDPRARRSAAQAAASRAAAAEDAARLRAWRASRRTDER